MYCRLTVDLKNCDRPGRQNDECRFSESGFFEGQTSMVLPATVSIFATHFSKYETWAAQNGGFQHTVKVRTSLLVDTPMAFLKVRFG
jgi:hypothetical protein